MEIVEVAPRDGLQNESVLLSTDDKVELIERLASAGCRRIEATSFVHPDLVPAMADAEELMARLPRHPDVRYSALVLNERGLKRAVDAGVDEVNVVVVATDTFSMRNQNCTTEQGLTTWHRIAHMASEAGLGVGVTIAAAFGCPFEGEVPASRIKEIVESVMGSRPDEISLADTIGVGAPSDVVERLGILSDHAPGVPTRLHLHNTRNTGLANVLAGLQAGVSAIDTSSGGIGGCPFAPKATGNIPTEDVTYMLDRMQVETGLDVNILVDVAHWLGEELGLQTVGLVARAGVFPSAENSALRLDRTGRGEPRPGGR